MLKRELVDELRARKNSMIAALWANPSWDDQENDRPGTINQIEEDFENAVGMIYGEVDEDDGDEIDWDDPFWAAAKRGQDKIQVPKTDSADDIAVGDVKQAEQEAKAAEEYFKALQDVDQY